MENWRGFIREDAKKRTAIAQDMSEPESGYDPDLDMRQLYQKSDSQKKAAYKDMMKAGRSMKKLFAKHADRAFLESLVTVHWTTKKGALSLLQGGGRNELSCNAYLPGQVSFGRTWAPYGVVVKGHISLLANSMDDVMSGAGEAYTAADQERTKMSGANKGIGKTYPPETYKTGDAILVLDQEDWAPRANPRSTTGKGNHNEALVDNWQPVVVVLMGGGELMNSRVEQRRFKKHVDQLGLNIPVLTAAEAAKQL
jgi:hypothetical protein